MKKADEIRTVKNTLNYAKNYDACVAQGLTEQARFWFRKYKQACKLLGYDPLA